MSGLGDKTVNQWQAARSRAIGLAFEEAIESACEYYRKKGIANITKTPEAIKQIGVRNKYGQFLACHTKDAQPDFKGTLGGGSAIVFEAKCTEKDRLKMDKVTPHQTDELQLHKDLGACVFVLCKLGNEVWRIDWDAWIKQRETGKHKYFNREDMLKYAHQIRIKAGGIMDFLGVLD